MLLVVGGRSDDNGWLIVDCGRQLGGMKAAAEWLWMRIWNLWRSPGGGRRELGGRPHWGELAVWGYHGCLLSAWAWYRLKFSVSRWTDADIDFW